MRNDLKRLFAAVAMAALVAEVVADQTYFELNNRNYYNWIEPVEAPVLDANGVPLGGTNYLAELWGSGSPDMLMPLLDWWSRQRVFAGLRGTNGYFWEAAQMTVDNATAAGWAWLQVRVWDKRLGPKFEDVMVRGLGGYGQSPLFYAQGNSPFCDPPCVPAPLIGLRSFRLTAMSAVLRRGIRTQGDEVAIEWFGGFPLYQIQAAAELGTGWQDLGAPTAQTAITNAVHDGSQFFRVLGLAY